KPKLACLNNLGIRVRDGRRPNYDAGFRDVFRGVADGHRNAASSQSVDDRRVGQVRSAHPVSRVAENNRQRAHSGAADPNQVNRRAKRSRKKRRRWHVQTPPSPHVARPGYYASPALLLAREGARDPRPDRRPELSKAMPIAAMTPTTSNVD